MRVQGAKENGNFFKKIGIFVWFNEGKNVEEMSCPCLITLFGGSFVCLKQGRNAEARLTSNYRSKVLLLFNNLVWQVPIISQGQLREILGFS